MQAMAHYGSARKGKRLFKSDGWWHAPGGPCIVSHPPWKFLRHWRGWWLSQNSILVSFTTCNRMPMIKTNQEENLQMNSIKYSCISLQRKNSVRLTCEWMCMSAYRQREGIYRQLLWLCKSCTKFHKSVQVSLPKAPKFPYWVGN